MKTKQYVAFLQTRSRQPIQIRPPAGSRLGKVKKVIPVTDKITLMVEAAEPFEAKGKLRNMVATAARFDPDLRGVTEVSLLQLVEIRKVPARGLVLRHEAVFDLQSMCILPDRQTGTRQLVFEEGGEVLWKA